MERGTPSSPDIVGFRDFCRCIAAHLRRSSCNQMLNNMVLHQPMPKVHDQILDAVLATWQPVYGGPQCKL